MDKKGQGIAIETIIKAIIAVVVLTVLIFVITKYARQSTATIDDCGAKGGEELSSGQTCIEKGGVVIFTREVTTTVGKTTEKSTKYCCVVSE